MHLRRSTPHGLVTPVSRSHEARRRPPRPVEPLESRVLLSASFVPAGPEFRIATPAEVGRVGRTDFSPHPVAADQNGDFVVTWVDADASAPAAVDQTRIMARLYSADGTPAGAPIVVDNQAGSQFAPSVAMNRNGSFAVTWETAVQGMEQSDIYVRVFARNGAPRRDPVRVNVDTNFAQRQPDVGIDDRERVVVTWVDFNQLVDNGFAVNFRLFASDGVPLTGDVTAGSGGFGAFTNSLTSVAMNGDGDFALAWATRVDSRLHSYIVTRRYNDRGEGEPLFVVAPEGDNNLLDANVTINLFGDIVVAWWEQPGNGRDGEIYARALSHSGRLGLGAIHVNTQTAGDQDTPSVAMDNLGNFLVTWETAVSSTDPDSLSVAARSFNRDGTPLADEFMVNTTTKGGQGRPGVALDANGDGVVVWTSDDVDAAGDAKDGVFGRRVRFGTLPTTPTIVGRHLFYGDTSNPVIDTTKDGLLPGQTATFANVSNDPRGITGVAIDLANFHPTGDIRLSDFKVRAGDGGDPSIWAEAASPSSFRAFSTGDGGGRVLLHWAAGAVTGKWVQITLPASPETTGLARPDVFYFGSLPGDTGNGAGGTFAVNALDLAAVKRSLNQDAEVGSPVDINHDGRVNALDLAIARANLNHSLAPFAAPASAAAIAAPLAKDRADATGTGLLL